MMITSHIVEYSLCSAIYMLLLLIYLIRYPSLPTFKTKSFRALFGVTFAGLLFDVGTEFANWEFEVHHANTYLNYYFVSMYNFFNLSFTVLVPFFVLIYVLCCTGKITAKNKKPIIISLIPHTIYTVCLVCCFFTKKGIFYIDQETGEYVRANMYYMTDIFVIGYAVAAVIVAASNKKFLLNKKVAIAAFLITHLVALVIRQFDTELSLNATANAVTMVVYLFTIETYDSYLEHEVFTFNELAASQYLNYLTYKTDTKVSVFIATITNIDDVVARYQDRLTIQYKKGIVARMKKIFPHMPVFYMSGDNCVVYIPKFIINNDHMQEYYKQLNVPMVVQGVATQPAIHISLIKYDDRYQNAEMLAQMIDKVMVDQRESRSNPAMHILVTDRSFYDKVVNEAHMLKVLNETISNNTAEVYYQPIVASDEKRVRSLEALCRVKDPTTGKFLNPEVFIKLAENNGSIVTLGEQIYKKVIQLASTGKLQQLGVKHVSVNLSMKQCEDENLAQRYLDIAKEYHVDPDFIILEVTESKQVHDLEMVKSVINSFISRGFRFSLDDFGTGYSNFAYLLELPISTIKIDKSVLYRALESERNDKVFNSIVSLISNMNVASVVEGVENTKQAEYLENLGLYRHQGWLYSKALPVDELFYFLLEYNSQEFGEEKSKFHGQGKNRVIN